MLQNWSYGYAVSHSCGSVRGQSIAGRPLYCDDRFLAVSNRKNAGLHNLFDIKSALTVNTLGITMQHYVDYFLYCYTCTKKKLMLETMNQNQNYSIT